jgi:tetratricopeptide (TPR) repeat protein
VLQFISCGAAIMADRYAYVSSIGILFGIAYFMNEFIKRYPALKTVTLAVFMFLSAGLAYGCYNRTKVWHDTETLYKDAISKYPYRALLSYKWLGYYYINKGDTNQAVENFGVLAELNAGDAKTYDQLGNIYVARGNYKDAIDLYNRSIKEQNDVYLSYVDRSIVYASLGDSANAIKDYVQAIRLNRDAEKRYAEHSFNMVQSQKYKEVIGQYNTLLMINPNNAYYYFYRAVAKFGLNEMNGAISDFIAAYKANIKDVSNVAAFNLAIACDSVGDIKNAQLYADAATKMGMPPKADFMNKLKVKSEKLKGKREY